MLRIGLVLPNSNFIGKLAADIKYWAAAGLSGGGFSGFEIAVETTPYNASASELKAKMQDLLIKQDVDVLIAPLNSGML